MSKAILKKDGKGWKLDFNNGKNPTTCSWRNIPNDWENAEVEVELVSGQPVTIKKGGEILNKPSAPPLIPRDGNWNPDRGNYHGNQNQQRGNNNRGYYNTPNDNNQNNHNNNNPMQPIPSAKSPYNFVPLNDTVFHPDEQSVFFDKYDEERNTGYIELDIENLTPIFIRGDKERFLMVNDKPVIPGSSMRGLIRNMVEIVSYSKLEFINNSRFYFRSFADTATRYKDEYNKEISKSTKVGVLFQNKDRNYVLVPSELVELIGDTSKENICKLDESANTWMLYSGRMPGGATAKKHNYKIEGRKIDDSGTIDIKWDDHIIKEYNEDINRKKGFSVLDKLKSVKVHRTHGIPVFYQSKIVKGKTIVTSFGNTKNYRLPYNQTIKDHLYEDHLNSSKRLDFTSLIFGTVDERQSIEQAIASRVYFEDTKCENALFDSECVLKILATPKPTSFQLYLEQPYGVKTRKENLVHWNDTGAPIRGYKQYWHRINHNHNTHCHRVSEFQVKMDDFKTVLEKVIRIKDADNHIRQIVEKGYAQQTVDAYGQQKLAFKGDLSTINPQVVGWIKQFFSLDDRKAKDLNVSKPQYSLVKPLKTNNKFHGRIRFENLTNEELGALLFALELPIGCCHKIGMGKPLGLGSIRITPKLVLDDRAKRYETLLNNDGVWALPVKPGNTDFKKKFTDLILKVVDIGETDLWQTERLRQLKAMLEYDENRCAQDIWLNKTKYMDLPEFKKREVLDTPMNILKQHKP
jgi:CRISPR/Cas system CSM-associated protein Csm3 (group 7 of RAMP superfamily)